MDMYKLKFTRLQNEIFRLLCVRIGKDLNQREIARKLNVSPTAVSKAIKGLEKEQIVKIKKNSKMNLNSIQLNREIPKIIGLKRTENLRIIYELGLVDFLEEKFPGSTIILFGSYSYGEDTVNSDIDFAVVGAKQKNIDLEKYEKILEKEIRINFYDDFKEIHKNLRANILNGVVLIGRIGL